MAKLFTTRKRGKKVQPQTRDPRNRAGYPPSPDPMNGGPTANTPPNVTANERQVGGDHYQKGSGQQQHWDIVAQFGLDYFQGQITKYVMRWKEKGGVQDLEKARHFLDKYIETAQQGLIGQTGQLDRKLQDDFRQ